MWNNTGRFINSLQLYKCLQSVSIFSGRTMRGCADAARTWATRDGGGFVRRVSFAANFAALAHWSKYISPPIWVNNCPRSAPPSAAVHLATPNHCLPNVKRSSRSMNSPVVRLLSLRGSSANDTRYDADGLNTNILCQLNFVSVLLWRQLDYLWVCRVVCYDNKTKCVSIKHLQRLAILQEFKIIGIFTAGN